MKIKRKAILLYKVKLLLMSIVLIISLFTVIAVLISKQDNKLISPHNEQDIINNCWGKGIIDASYCLRDSISTFYKYNITDDSINESFDEIKSRGGDCRDYAFLYARLGSTLGFNSSTLTTSGISTVMASHRWAILWDDFYYCELDQLYINCQPRNKNA